MSSFASSASPDLVHWHAEVPTHLIRGVTGNIMQAVQEAANEAIYHTEQALFEAKELFVTAEHSAEAIAEYFGVHPFQHQFFGNLIGTTLVLRSDGILEIHREGQEKHTTFPVVARVA